MNNHLLSPYKDKYGANVRNMYFQPKPPLTGDVDKSVKLSENLWLYELYNASFVRPEERNKFTYIPMDVRIPKVFQLLRDALGKAITPTSFFRSYRHEIFKGRDGTSTHVDGIAIDLTGQGLVDLVLEALETKNDLYKKLRALGVNGFGVYKKKNFVHLDLGPTNFMGGHRYWNGDDDKELKKKGSFTFKVAVLVVAIPMFFYGIYKYYKNRKKRK